MYRVLFLLLALCAPPAAAQVCVTGVVEPHSGPSICMQAASHQFECGSVLLRSATIDLRQYEGRTVRVTGRDVGVTCHVIEVTRVDPPFAELTWCGSGSVGCPLKLKVCPVGMGRYWMFLGLAPGFRPVGCSNTGWFDGTLLVREPILPLVSGGAGLCGELVLPVPMDNSLVGVRLWFQGARQDIGPIGPLQLTNAGCVQLAPFMPPCAPTNC